MADVVTIIYDKENPEDAVSLGVILILMVQFKFILDFWSSKTRLLFCLRLCQENGRTASRIAVVIKAEFFFHLHICVLCVCDAQNLFSFSVGTSYYAIYRFSMPATLATQLALNTIL